MNVNTNNTHQPDLFIAFNLLTVTPSDGNNKTKRDISNNGYHRIPSTILGIPKPKYISIAKNNICNNIENDMKYANSCLPAVPLKTAYCFKHLIISFIYLHNPKKVII